MNRRIPDAKLCTSESSSNSSVGRGPETWHAPIVHQIPKAGSVSCPLFTNAPRGSSYTKTTAAGEIDFGSNFIGPTLTRLEAGDPLVLLSGTHVGCFELFAHEQVRAVRDLKGKTMAVGQLGGSEHTFISSILAYVGIDPQKEVHWVTHPFDASTQLFAEGKIDAVAAQPPQSQELRARQIGHVLVNSTVDRPWSQYYCCMVYTHKAFVQQYPVATKRVLRAILKAADLCTSEPERAARFLVDKGYTKTYDYARETMQDVVYRQWREYEPEDTVRFYALRMQEAGMITSTPQKLIAQGTDWRFFNALKKELKG